MAARSLGSGVGRLLRGLQGRSGQSGWSLSVSRSTATRLPGCVPAAAQPGSYPALSAQAAQEPAAFWGPLARDTLVWDTPYHTVWDCDFRTGKIGWFLGGQLNVSVNCLDQHVQKSPETIALIWERDEPGTEVRITYKEACSVWSTELSYMGVSGYLSYCTLTVCPDVLGNGVNMLTLPGGGAVVV